MKHGELTHAAIAAKHLFMNRVGSGFGKRGLQILPLTASMMLIAGCISVNAPNEAIVIELNINIKQEVIYRLAEDAGNTIEENADIF